MLSNETALARFNLGLRHGLLDVAEDSVARGETDSAFRDRLRRRLAARALGGSFSFARLISSLSAGGYGVDGLEREILQEASRENGESFDARKPVVPWSLFARDLNASTASSGGYLVGTGVADALDVLRPWSVTARAGITFLEGLRGSVTIPRTSAKASGNWLAAETSTLTESQPTLGQIALTPKGCGGLVEFSRQLDLQSSVELYVRNELLRTIGTLVDQAILSGSGVSGQPTGLLNTAGLLTQSGTTLGHAGVVDMKAAAAGANARDDAIAFLTTPAVRAVLEKRERATGSGYVWDNDRVASRPGYATTDMPAGTMVAGDWSDVLLALWGPGFEISLNPYEQTKFTQGIVQARLLVAIDVAIGHPGSFCVASSIT